MSLELKRLLTEPEYKLRESNETLPIAWRFTDNYLKIFFKRISLDEQATLKEETIKLDCRILTEEDGKIVVLSIPAHLLGVHTLETSENISSLPPLRMNFKYDEQADCLYLDLSDEPKENLKTIEMIEDTLLFDTVKGKVISIEVIGSSDVL